MATSKLTPNKVKKDLLIICGLCGEWGTLYYKKCTCEYCMDDPTILLYHTGRDHCIAVKPMNFECLWYDNDNMFIWNIDWDLEVV